MGLLEFYILEPHSDLENRLRGGKIDHRFSFYAKIRCTLNGCEIMIRVKFTEDEV